jgi:hypothetical protein
MRLLIARKRQIELLLAVGAMVAAAYTAPLIAYGLVMLTFGLILDVATAAWAGASSTGSLRDYRQ